MSSSASGALAPPVFRMIAPPDGGWSLTPIESLLRGLRNMEELFALELCGWNGGAVSYMVRSHSGARLQGMLQSYYPHARAELLKKDGVGIHADWLRLDSDERALVKPMWLDKESYLPMMTYDDHVLRESESDPLAGVVGHVSGLGRWSGGSQRDRMGMRLVLHPAHEDWARKYQSRIQARRDGDDKLKDTKGNGQADMSTASMVALMGLLGLGGVGYLNWDWYQSGEYLKLLALDGGLIAALVGGLWGWGKVMGRKSRQYMDEELVEEKLKSLGFQSEVQLVRVYRGGISEQKDAERSLGDFVDVMRQFDNPAGNAWKEGPVQEFDGMDLSREHGGLAMAAASEALRWRNGGQAKRSILSAREVSTFWHLPLGVKDMASIDRSQSAVLTPILEGLDENGPLVGHTEAGHPIYFPESSLRKHMVLLGRSGSGKSTMIKHFMHYKMQAKARGEDDGAIVLIDPHADLVHDILPLVPPEIADKVRLLDLGDDQRVPIINMLDPDLAPDRDRCVGTLIETFKYMFDAWGNRLEEILDRGLKAIYEYNAHPDTPKARRLTILDMLVLLQDGKPIGSGRGAKVERTQFQKHVFSRVSDAHVKLWFEQFMNLPRESRAEGMGPVANRIGAFAGNFRAKVVMGMRESTVVFSDILKEGIILLVSTASGKVGPGTAALMGGAVVSMVDSALREQESLLPENRKNCLLIADEFSTITGTNWAGMFAEVRKYGCSLMLATQSMAVLDRPGSDKASLKTGIMSNVGCIVSYAISAEDAPMMSRQMGAERLTESDLVMLDPFHCYVRITTDVKSLPTFSMKTAPPPEKLHGRPENEERVRELMYSYTVDRRDALRQINSEALDALWGGGAGLPVEGVASGSELGADGPAAGPGPAPASPQAPPRELESPEPVDAVAAAPGTERGDGEEWEPPPRVVQHPAVASGNPFSQAMNIAEPLVPLSARERVAERLGEDVLASSELTPEVIEKVWKLADSDPALRVALDTRLEGKTGRAMKQRTRDYNEKLESKDAEIARLMAELESATNGANGGAAAVAEAPAEAYSMEELDAAVTAVIEQEREIAREPEPVPGSEPDSEPDPEPEPDAEPDSLPEQRRGDPEPEPRQMGGLRRRVVNKRRI